MLKQVDRGKYVLGESVQAYIEYASGGKEDDCKPRLIDERTEHMRVKKEIAAIELAERKQNLHVAEDIRAVMNDMVGVFQKRIRAIPDKIGPRLIGLQDVKVIKGALTNEVHAALLELSNYEPEALNEQP